MTRAGAPGPDFIGIGPGKTGTTWIWEQLRAHPNVFLPDKKELHYFDDELFGAPGAVNLSARRPLSWYAEFFAPAPTGQLRGEITPSYFHSAVAPGRVAAAFPDVTLFAILRNPTDRIFSLYLFARQKGEIADVDFDTALVRYPHLVERAYLAPALVRWRDHFPAEQLHVMNYDDLRSDPNAFIRDLQRRLGIAAYVAPAAGRRVNETGVPRYPRMNRALMATRQAARRSPLTERAVERMRAIGLGRGFSWVQGQVLPFDTRPAPAPGTTRWLTDRYRADVETVEALTGFDLNAWKRAA